MKDLKEFMRLALPSQLSCDVCDNANREPCRIVTHKATQMRLCDSCYMVYTKLYLGKQQQL